MAEQERKIPVIIDTDPGVDDVVSIMWVLSSGRFDVKALTVSNGNVGVDKCVINALRTLEICNRTDIPVYGGAYRPLTRPAIDASWVHGQDGLGDLGIPAPKVTPGDGYAPVRMAEIVKASPEPVTILAIGPLTNVALAILLDPDFARNVKEILFMGGVFRFSGNESPRASYNVKVDPEAARVVYRSGIPVVQLGLDVCDLVTQTLDDIETIGRCGTRQTDFAYKLLVQRRDHAIKKIRTDTGEVKEMSASAHAGRTSGIGMNDLTTTGYLMNPGWFKTMRATMDVETSGLCDGETVIDYLGLWGKEPNGYFAYEVDGPALVSQWVKDMLAYRPDTTPI